MAFDGPTPFDGDPVYMYLDQIEDAPSADIADAIRSAFEFILGDDDYFEIDETVWAWGCAEILASALGRGALESPPGAFGIAAKALSADDADPLREQALAALAVVVDEERSEIAELWNESGDNSLESHIAELRKRLSK